MMTASDQVLQTRRDCPGLHRLYFGPSEVFSDWRHGYTDYHLSHRLPVISDYVLSFDVLQMSLGIL